MSKVISLNSMVKAELSKKGVTVYSIYLLEKIRDVENTFLRYPYTIDEPLYVKINRDKLKKVEETHIYEGQLHELMSIFKGNPEYFENNTFSVSDNDFYIYNDDSYGLRSDTTIIDEITIDNRTPEEIKRDARKILNEAFLKEVDVDREGILKTIEELKKDAQKRLNEAILKEVNREGIIKTILNSDYYNLLSEENKNGKSEG